jgi:hypothetical protein
MPIPLRAIVGGLIILWYAGPVRGQAQAGGTTDPFNEIGMGAYSLGRGGTYAGEMVDSLSNPLNPASMGQYLDYSIHFFTAPLDSSNLYFVQGSYRAGQFGSGCLSWSMWRDAPQLYLDTTNVRYDIDMRRIPGDSIWFSNNDHLFIWSHGLELRGGFSAGLNFKYIRRTQVSDYTGNGFGLDLGIIQKEWIPNLSWGLVLQDLGKARVFYPSGHRDYFSQTARLGVKYQVIRDMLDFSLDVSRVLGLDPDYPVNAYLGVQYFPLPQVSFRAGLHHIEYAQGALYYYFSMGIGLQLSQFVINYSLWESPENTGFSSPHRISLIYRVPLESWRKAATP